jgi:hypothetical protein
MHGLIRQVWGRRAWTRAGGTVTRVALNGMSIYLRNRKSVFVRFKISWEIIA